GRRAIGASIGRERRPVHQRRAHHGVGTAHTARRTLDHCHRGRRRVPHRHSTHTAGLREGTVDRAPGLSVRLKLTLSYAGFLMLAGVVLLAVGYLSLSRGVHPGVIFMVRSHTALVRDFAPTAAIVLPFLLVFGLVGGWL